ncbi:MAG: prepilin-type N-terminal cleavage/methylation domain-containing protein [Candidatus Obscuribacterales bacterium]|nr:prepilin-type N-terminal cleavage/methylation domain-containing protein [Candidatus Obscuribacterales bacterium]
MKTISRAKGFTLVELLVVVLVMSFISAAAFGMMTAVMTQGNSLSNKCDTIDSIRNAMEKFGRDVRMGRSIGDVYGNLVGGQNIVQGSRTFPSNNNPLYGGGLMPTSGVNSVPFTGWPTWADGTTPTSFTCDNTTCVVQVPIFEADGFPSSIPAGVSNGIHPGFGFAEDNCETHVYRVVPDSSNPGEFILQFAIIPGLNITGGTPRSVQVGPITLVNHIIGPINPNTGAPRIFQYLDKENNPGSVNNSGFADWQPEDAPTTNGTQNSGALVANYSGIVLNLEVNSNTYSRNQPNRKPLAVKTEVFLRNNSQTTTIGAT